ncbi:serine hydrolase [Lutimonas sp.]|uniref:serine hydrolase n=1 Tax=Lutimonas sp. TaxID=1872403 RepID=UPI003D9BC5EC
MKILYSILSLFLVFQSCNNRSQSTEVNNKELLVESNLIPPVYFENQKTWNIEERMKHYGVPGVSIAVIQDHKIAWSKAYGIMDKESKEPVTLTTLFQAGSISKPVAAYGALHAADKGQIDLTENVNTYLSSWKLPDNEFTEEQKVGLKHLLSHTGGLTVHGFLGYSPDLEVPTLTEVLDGLPPANSPAIYVDKRPEKSFRYSGGGYTVMQQMMIDIMGKPYPELMAELVLNPLQMINSTYDQPLHSEMLGVAATGYLPDGSMTKGKRHTYPEMAAAGLWTTSEDLAKFAIDVQQASQGTSEKVLSKKMANQMLTPFVEDFNGLGLFINKMGDEIYFGHGGWDEGFSSELIAHKTKGYGVVVLTNSNHPDFISELIRSVALSYNWDDYVTIHSKKEMNWEEVASIEGRYKINNDDLVEITKSGEKLMMKKLGRKEVELIRITDSTYISDQNNEPIYFDLKKNPEIVTMTYLHPYNNGVLRSYEPIPVDETLPMEYLINGDHKLGLEAYLELQKNDEADEAISENRLNRTGYMLLSEDKIELAKAVFSVNTVLYPDSFNVYDSFAEACMINKEYDLAIANYQKSLDLNPQNTHAQDMIDDMKN